PGESARFSRQYELGGGCTRQQGRLTVHLLEAKAFAAQFKTAVVVVLRSAVRMSLHEPAQSHRKLVTDADHCLPPLTDALQILLAFRAQYHDAVHGEQLRLKLTRLFMERRAEVKRNRRQ